MARQARLPELPALGQLDRRAGGLARQLAQLMRQAILRGELVPGQALPSTRLLAQSLQLARGTVVEAFDQLVAEGYLASRAGAGTQVAQDLPVMSLARPAECTDAVALPTPAADFIRVAQDFRTLPHIPFAISVPLGATAPDAQWRRLGNRLRARGEGAPAGYGDPQGALVLRQAIAHYVRKSRSVHCDASQVIITGGTQQGLYLACQVLLGTGERAWVENPAYAGITSILGSSGRGASVVRVEVDDEGLVVAQGRQLAPDARAAFVTPSHQYPLGMPMSMARREALLAWARQAGAWIVEDDYDSELRYAGHPFPALQGLDPARVIYLGTFSKVLYPSLRLGYLIAPPSLVPAFCGARVLMDRSPPGADQFTLAAYMEQGWLERHVRRVRGVYAEHRQQLMQSLSRLLSPQLAWLQPSDQGMHLLLWLNAALDDRAVAASALQAGVAVRPVSPMFAPGSERPGLVLGFGGFSAQEMEQAVQKLAQIIAAA